MTEKKQSSSPSLTDWAKVEAYELTAQDYVEMPEWTDAQIARAQVSVGGKVIRPATGTLMRAAGRPKSQNPKIHQGLRLSPDVLAYFRNTGKGWQGRIDAALKEWIAQH